MLEYFYEFKGDYAGNYTFVIDGLCGDSYSTFK